MMGYYAIERALSDANVKAYFSQDKKFRYFLKRSLPLKAEHKRVAWIQVNPSSADGQTDDATIRKNIGFTKLVDGSEMIVVNLFPYISTDIRGLKTAEADVTGGELNSYILRTVCETSHVVFCAWGSSLKLPKNLRSRSIEVCNMLSEYQHKMVCLGYTKDGQPKHPLMLGYSTIIEAFPRDSVEQRCI